ncbi:MAG: PepSY-like domain-containing protein [Chitinophagales bacterium]|nr:PepSY-like domain-containing protein [Chitinophagales bacterium]
MKKNIMIAMIAALFSVNAVYAQLRKIPAEVTNNFTEKFPDATNVEWQDQLVDFKVVFDENDKNYRVKFSNNGEWKMTERIIKKDFLPTSVIKGFSRGEYAKWEIKEVTIVETPETNNQYKITVAKNSLNKKDLLFNTDGQLVKDNFTF